MISAPTPYVYAANPIVSPKVTPPSIQMPMSVGLHGRLQICRLERSPIYGWSPTCHGCSGNGLGSYGGTLIVTPANYKQEPFRSMKDDEWFWHVSEGIQGSVMPPWRESLTVDERWNVIRYIQTTFARPVMRDPAEGDPSGQYANLTNPLTNSLDVIDQGKHIFTRECLVCHGDVPRGRVHTEITCSPLRLTLATRVIMAPFKTLCSPTHYYWRISEGLP